MNTQHYIPPKSIKESQKQKQEMCCPIYLKELLPRDPSNLKILEWGGSTGFTRSLFKVG